MTTSARKAFLWLVLFTLAYLAVELHFNATLLSIASSAVSTAAQISDVEHYGRTVSGFGFGLTLLGFLAGSGFLPNSKLALLWGAGMIASVGVFWFAPGEELAFVFFPVVGTILAGLIAYISLQEPENTGILKCLVVLATFMTAVPGMYFGQKYLLDELVINPSSGEDRLLAKNIALLKSGLSNYSVAIDELDLEAMGGRETPEAQTLLSLIGAVAMNAEPFVNSIMDNATRKTIVEQVARNRMLVDLDEKYAQYQDAGANFERDFVQIYGKHSKEYGDVPSRAGRKVDEEWSRMQAELDNSFKRYTAASDQFLEDMREFYGQIYPDRLQRFYKSLGRCDTRACVNKHQEDFNKQWARSRSKAPAPDQMAFCRRETDGEAAGRAVGDFAGLRLLDLFDNLQGDRQWKCPAEPNTVFNRVVEIHIPSFTESSGGRPPFMSQQEFRAHSSVIQEVRNQLAGRGLKLPASWTPLNKQAFADAVYEKANGERVAKWRTSITNALGFYLPPGLSRQQLISQKDVQSVIRQKVGDDIYISGWRWDWSHEAFTRQVVLPRIDQAIKDEVSEFKSNAVNYADGGSLEELGKSAYRAILVPVISLTLSLAFAIFTAVKAVSSIVLLLTGGHRYALIASKVAVLAAATLIVFAPLSITNAYTESGAYKRLHLMAMDSSPAVASLADWTIRIEPIIAPIGMAMVRTYNPLGAAIVDAKSENDDESSPTRPVNLPDDYAPELNANLVREVQKAVGATPDGDYGPNTARAVRNWQQENGYEPADGRISVRLLQFVRENT
ncbi:peptidoglycan-binding domain-containing protein [Thalassospira xiamenensis]|uniref:Peptidoglycan binding domain-containing protein n=1 Tax=Thalassospira xiamenensis TaxID=220697 RepID=A0A285TY84_9PROT|nr:peptidoglycan-binding protein [Thalassospira xiamenensis]SOC30953.1 Putative peptidoglycan binding domain-containing protein [Thalassospira xiamenensis]